MPPALHGSERALTSEPPLTVASAESTTARKTASRFRPIPPSHARRRAATRAAATELPRLRPAPRCSHSNQRKATRVRRMTAAEPSAAASHDPSNSRAWSRARCEREGEHKSQPSATNPNLESHHLTGSPSRHHHAQGSSTPPRFQFRTAPRHRCPPRAPKNRIRRDHWLTSPAHTRRTTATAPPTKRSVPYSPPHTTSTVPHGPQSVPIRTP